MGKKKQDTSRNNHVQNVHAKPSKAKSKKKDSHEKSSSLFGNHGSSLYIVLVFVLGKCCMLLNAIVIIKTFLYHGYLFFPFSCNCWNPS